MNSYEDLVSDNGKYTILVEVSDNDYQGETRFFLHEGNYCGDLVGNEKFKLLVDGL